MKQTGMKEKKLRPCDCYDIVTANRLETQGIKHNDQGIHIEPNSVFLTMGHTTIRIPMNRFRMFAEWYLEPQELDKNISPPSTQEETNEEIEAKFAKASKKIIDNAPVVAAYKKVNQEEPTTQIREDLKGCIQMLNNMFQWAKVKDGRATHTTSEETWNVYKKFVSQCEEHFEVISSEPTQEEWISVKDQKPSDKEIVIIGHDRDKWTLGGYYDAHNKMWFNQHEDAEFDPECYPTHWRPMPKI